jgi:hypothetical protein
VVIDQRLRRICEAYFGHGAQVLEGTVEIPGGPWNDLGRITHIYYARYGKEDGLFHHPIKRDAPPALLQQNRRGCYRLSLPGGCLVDSHGFVWP